MPKYRILNLEELKALEQDFVIFLSGHGVSAEDWKAWQTHNSSKTEEYISLFSDYVFASMIDKTRYLIKTSAQLIQYVSILQEKFILIQLHVKNHNFLEMSTTFTLDIPGLQVYKGEKKMYSELEMEIFLLFEQGFLPVKKSEEQSVALLFEKVFGNYNDE